ncbi:hypothetical protein OG562_26245 [Streptomyces sp. NBC_01275]|uniref:hypothetical protein n=1 Tax=Streptomyces sp. NBC_01275 TaxID=2903807 RepID=UPI00224EA299|nr:hypothetical protein [Streptomyces sp. NBC_01275]MCX4764396.1 hypothetical protein [Streptomyces sp. NBC_01275]
MRRPGPALRVGLLGVAVVLLGYALLAAWAGFHAQRYLDARDRASATAPGVVVEDHIGDDDDIRVRWTDDEGRTRVQRFGVYDTGRYLEGDDFPVDYDPAESSPRGFPADPDETADEDDLLAPLFIGALVAVPLLCVWAWRGLRFRLTALRPGRPTTAYVRFGARQPTILRDAKTTWLELADLEGGRHWQRVMWHPALDGVTGPVEATVHRAKDGTRLPAVVALPDGTRLVPLGRLRTRPSPGVVFDDHDAVRTDLRDAFVLPAGTVPRPAVPWRRRIAHPALVGLVLGPFPGVFLTGGSLTGTVSVTLGVAALLTSAWALSAPQP